MADTKRFTILKVFGDYFSAERDFERFCKINGRMGEYFHSGLTFMFTDVPLTLLWRNIHDNNQEAFKGIEVQSVWIDNSVNYKYYSLLNSRVRNVK